MTSEQTDWTRGGPAKWCVIGVLGGASVVGLAWSIATRRQLPRAEPGITRQWMGRPRDLDAPAPAQLPRSPESFVSDTPPVHALGEHAPGAVVESGPSLDVPREDQSHQPTVEPIKAPLTDSIARRIDVNRASAVELELLPGIGPSLAKRIVEDRSLHGPFRSVQDLARVKGIGPKTCERIVEYAVAR